MRECVKKVLISLNKKVFRYLLIFYLTILLVRQFNEDLLKFLDIGYISILTIIFGAITVLTYQPEHREQKRLGGGDNSLIYFLGVVGALLVYFRLKDFAWVGYLISVLSGILIVVLIRLCIVEDESNIEIEQ